MLSFLPNPSKYVSFKPIRRYKAFFVAHLLICKLCFITGFLPYTLLGPAPLRFAVQNRSRRFCLCSLYLVTHLSRRLSENREPTAKKPFWPIFPLILVKYEPLFASNDRKNELKMASTRYGFYSRTAS